MLKFPRKREGRKAAAFICEDRDPVHGGRAEGKKGAGRREGKKERRISHPASDKPAPPHTLSKCRCSRRELPGSPGRREGRGRRRCGPGRAAPGDAPVSAAAGRGGAAGSETVRLSPTVPLPCSSCPNIFKFTRLK